jgi:hypothetical protein
VFYLWNCTNPFSYLRSLTGPQISTVSSSESRVQCVLLRQSRNLQSDMWYARGILFPASFTIRLFSSSFAAHLEHTQASNLHISHNFSGAHHLTAESCWSGTAWSLEQLSTPKGHRRICWLCDADAHEAHSSRHDARPDHRSNRKA